MRGGTHGATRDLALLLAGWLLLAAAMTLLALPSLDPPGMNYEEATLPAQAKDFLTGHAHRHVIGAMAVPFRGRPLPLFAQPYLGAPQAWLTAPGIALFGASPQVVRLTSLAWSILALLLFMLWVRALLGAMPALAAGALLALDPSYFFISLYGWGPVVPGFLARLGAFLLALHWWRRRRWESALLAGICCGLGLYHKLDFVAVLAGAGVATLVAYRDEVLPALLAAWRHLLLALLGLLIGLGPMTWRVITMLTGVVGDSVHEPLALGFKLRVLLAMYDGSYPLRLIALVGDPNVFRLPSPVHGGFGVAVLAAILFATLVLARRLPALRRLIVFALTALLVTTVAVLLLPGAKGIHHALLAYPWPQLLVAIALAGLVAAGSAAGRSQRVALAVLLLTLVLADELRVVRATQRLIAQTGGRGFWSSGIDDLARDVHGRADLTIVSLDWGFDEQLILLTDGPRLWEPIWGRPPRPPLDGCDAPDRIYLVHPPALTVIPLAAPYLRACSERHGARLRIHPYRNREGQIGFYAVRFTPP